MKKLLIILLLVPLVSFSQSELRLPTTVDTDFTWKVADGTYVTVAFENDVDDSLLSDEVLQKVVMNVMTQSKFTLKIRNSFKPIKLMIFNNDDSFNAVSIYTGKNAYGTELESTTYFSFTNEGDGSVKKY